MAEPLVTVTQLEDRLGRSLDTTDTTQAEALLGDASALVREVADMTFMDDDTGELDVPDAVVPVVVSMVRRALDNPRGLTGETLGDYSWQAQTAGVTGTIYATRNERRIIRRAAGTLGVGTAQLEGYLPLREGVDLTGSL